MTEQRIIEFVDKMVIADQTELVEWIMSLEDESLPTNEDSLCFYDDIIYPDVFLPKRRMLEHDYKGLLPPTMSVWDEVCLRSGGEINSWKLINPCYLDILKGCDMPYFELQGQTWLGKTMTNSLTEWQHLRDYIKNLDNE